MAARFSQPPVSGSRRPRPGLRILCSHLMPWRRRTTSSRPEDIRSAEGDQARATEAPAWSGRTSSAEPGTAGTPGRWSSLPKSRRWRRMEDVPGALAGGALSLADDARAAARPCLEAQAQMVAPGPGIWSGCGARLSGRLVAVSSFLALATATRVKPDCECGGGGPVCHPLSCPCHAGELTAAATRTSQPATRTAPDGMGDLDRTGDPEVTAGPEAVSVVSDHRETLAHLRLLAIGLCGRRPTRPASSDATAQIVNGTMWSTVLEPFQCRLP